MLSPAGWQRKQCILGKTFARVLTLLGHSDFQALLQPTVLAAVAGDFVDDAVFLPVTSVHHVLLDAPPEEALRDTEDTEIKTQTGHETRFFKWPLKVLQAKNTATTIQE